MRHLVLVLGDQLDADSTAFVGFDERQDAVLMMEVAEEATYVRQHKARLVLFFSAMRHFRDELAARGWPVHYRKIDDRENKGSFAGEIEAQVRRLKPRGLVVLQPGDYRVLDSLRETARRLELPLDVRADGSFYSQPSEFAEMAKNGRKVILENFYRAMRKKHGILMDGVKPVGGEWNFDEQNRQPLTKQARLLLKPPALPEPDEVTREVMRVVEKRFRNSPGSLAQFDYPVTRGQALTALDDFIAHRLSHFGAFQDAMSAGEPYLFHSRLSSSLNLHLLSAREVVDAAVTAYRKRRAPLNSVEGFVRQILGWREFVRGLYWTHMPEYAGLNYFDATLPVPRILWTGETDMNCIRHAAGMLHERAYAHHIHRLMVLGLYSLLLGVNPYRFHEWHISMFTDAIDWVSLPNALGMSQFGDGGIMGTKPYSASGAYINRMSDYCKACRFDPSKATGEDACPFTTLYWDFLSRHYEKLQNNARMRMQLNNVNRRDKSELVEIRRRADDLKSTTV
ncbi:MAG: cryptochrome/photolyase family protein [Bryobacteraceae bacterium]|nr:cryptochrome/photolyase family protein [Bryobacteraceae bacterium]